jgi:hypothetical protein
MMRMTGITQRYGVFQREVNADVVQDGQQGPQPNPASGQLTL